MSRSGVALAILLGTLSAPPRLNAQRLFGTVVLADERAPGAGAIVTVIDSTGKVVTRDLASGRGDYVIPLDRPGRYTLVAQRVGSLPETVRDVEVAAGRDVRTRIVLRGTAARPPQVAQRTRGVCNLAADTSGLATLWTQFQTALLSNAVAEASRVFVLTWDQAQRLVDATQRDTTSRVDSVERLALDIPVFPVLRPDSSERFGFVIEALDGVHYYVPGMVTLRSPGFRTRRCFAFEPAPDNQPGWIGLHFWPTGVRIGVSEVEGTVWFDAASLEPRAVTYIYTGLPPAFAPARPGGGFRLNQLATGHWIADEWNIRVPSGSFQRMFSYDVRGAPSGYATLRLEGVRITTARLAELSVNGTTIVRKPQ